MVLGQIIPVRAHLLDRGAYFAIELDCVDLWRCIVSLWSTFGLLLF